MSLQLKMLIYLLKAKKQNHILKKKQKMVIATK